MFSRTDSEKNACPYRLCQEGLELLAPYMRKRVVHCSAKDAATLLQMETPFYSQFTTDIGSTLQALRGLGLGVEMIAVQHLN